MPDDLEQKPNLQVERVEHVTIKAPEFMETAAAAWFSIIEAQFVLKGITASQTKFYHVLSILPGTVAALLPATVFEAKEYKLLKEAVISSYEKSKPEILERLLSSTRLTGRPSMYLKEIISLAAPIAIGEDMIRHKFIQALPQSISAVIASQSNLDLTALGKLADDLLPYFSNQASAMNVQQTAAAATSNTNYNRNYDRTWPAGLRPFNSEQRPKVCRAHLYFAGKAKFCKPWCKWPNKSSCKMLPNSRPASPTRSDKSNF